MMPLTSWLSNSIISSFKPSNPLSLTRTPTLPPNHPTLKCPCHPSPTSAQSSLCVACNSFVSRCHWIRLFSLPSSQFCKVSKRQLEKGSHLWDGDASESLNWEYVFKARRFTKGCHLCELFGTNGADEDVRCFGDEGVSMVISVRFDYVYGESGEAQLGVRIGNNGDGEVTSFRLYHEWADGRSDFIAHTG